MIKQIWVMHHIYDSTVPANLVKFDGETIKMTESTEYNKLMFILNENDVIMPMCSKDGATWEICFGATKKGSTVSLVGMKEDMRKFINLEWKNIEDEMPEPTFDKQLITLQEYDDFYHISPDYYTPSGVWLSNSPVTPCKVVKWAELPTWYKGEKWWDDVTISRIHVDTQVEIECYSSALETYETLTEMREEKLCQHFTK